MWLIRNFPTSHIIHSTENFVCSRSPPSKTQFYTPKKIKIAERNYARTLIAFHCYFNEPRSFCCDVKSSLSFRFNGNLVNFSISIRWWNISSSGCTQKSSTLSREHRKKHKIQFTTLLQPPISSDRKSLPWMEIVGYVNPEGVFTPSISFANNLGYRLSF